VGAYADEAAKATTTSIDTPTAPTIIRRLQALSLRSSPIGGSRPRGVSVDAPR
jgi:hypothetical protein